MKFIGLTKKCKILDTCINLSTPTEKSHKYLAEDPFAEITAFRRFLLLWRVSGSWMKLFWTIPPYNTSPVQSGLMASKHGQTASNRPTDFQWYSCLGTWMAIPERCTWSSAQIPEQFLSSVCVFVLLTYPAASVTSILWQILGSYSQESADVVDTARPHDGTSTKFCRGLGCPAFGLSRYLAVMHDAPKCVCSSDSENASSASLSRTASSCVLLNNTKEHHLHHLHVATLHRRVKENYLSMRFNA